MLPAPTNTGHASGCVRTSTRQFQQRSNAPARLHNITSTVPKTVILEKRAEPTLESCKRFSRVHSPRARLTVHIKPFTDSGQRSSAILTVSSPTFLAMNSETACCKSYGPDLDSSILPIWCSTCTRRQPCVSLVGGCGCRKFHQISTFHSNKNWK